MGQCISEGCLRYDDLRSHRYDARGSRFIPNTRKTRVEHVADVSPRDAIVISTNEPRVKRGARSCYNFFVLLCLAPLTIGAAGRTPAGRVLI